MAKFDADDIGRPGKPPHHRGFPWKLWLFALLMTAAAAGGGYFAWDFRAKSLAAGHDANSCLTNLGKLQGTVGDSERKATDCISSLAAKIDDSKALETQLTAMSTNLNASKEELAQLRSQRVETDKRLLAIEEIQKQFAKMIDTGQMKVTARRGSLVLSLPSEVLFPSGIADLSKPGELAVLEVGITLKRFPDRRFLVVGHADDEQLKNSGYKDNWDLSTARALTVTRFLIQAGMDPKNLVAAGAGEHDPISKDRPRNRRIEIALLPAINELPPLPASLTEDTGKPAAKPSEPPKPAPPAPKAEAEPAK